MIRVPHAVACPVVFNFLCDRGQQGGVLTKNDHFQVFLAVWVFGPVKEWDILKYHEIIRVSDLFAGPMVFNLLCHLSRQVHVPRLTKKAQF